MALVVCGTHSLVSAYERSGTAVVELTFSAVASTLRTAICSSYPLCLPVQSEGACAFSLTAYFQAGNSKGQIKVYNASTGKTPKGGSSKTAGAVLALALDSSGVALWAADSKGSMFSFFIDAATGRLQRLKRFVSPHPLVIMSTVPLHRVVVCPGSFISSISCRSWISREARDPSLLLSCSDSSLRLYRYTQITVV